MRIEVITMWYNEEFLAPFFLNHYNNTDQINILLDSDTNDKTLEVVEKYKNVKVIEHIFPDMMDDMIKSNTINELYKKLDCDWVFLVDCDEFVWPSVNIDIRDYLHQQSKDHHYTHAMLWQVYKHIYDKSLDPNLPILEQRNHGDSGIEEGQNRMYRKPIIVRGGTIASWQPGCHNLRTSRDLHSCNGHFHGAHWMMADVKMAIERRIKGRKERQSKYNIKHGLTSHQHNITEQDIIKNCTDHLYDPKVMKFHKPGEDGRQQ